MGPQKLLAVGVGVVALLVAPAAAQVDPSCCCLAHSTPYCSDAACQASVCAVDPFCCNTQWDQICANGAASLCAELCTFCGGGVGFDACYLGPAVSTGVGTAGSVFSNPAIWNNGVSGPNTAATIRGTIALTCDHAASQLVNQSGYSANLSLQGHSLSVAGLGVFTNFWCTGPGRLDFGVLALSADNYAIGLEGLEVHVEGALGLFHSAGSHFGVVYIGDSSPTSLECDRIVVSTGYGLNVYSHPESLLRALDTAELELTGGMFYLLGITELGGPIRVLPGAQYHARGTIRTQVFRNDGAMQSTMWDFGDSTLITAMVVDGDFENDPGPSQGNVDAVGSLRINACCGVTSGDAPLIDVTGEASLGGICYLAGYEWWPQHTVVLRADSLDPIRSGFDTLFLTGEGHPVDVAPRIVRSQDSQGRQIVALDLVPVEELAFEAQPPAALLWEPQVNAAFDFDRDGFEDHAVAVRNTSTGASALRVYLNEDGVIGTDYVSMPLAGPVVDMQAVPSSIQGEPQLLIATAPNGLIRVHQSGQALAQVTTDFYVQLPPNSEGLVAATALRHPTQSGLVAAVSTTWAGHPSTAGFFVPGDHGQWGAYWSKELQGRATCAAAGDLNLDGYDDLVVACEASPLFNFSTVTVIFGPGYTTFHTRSLAGSPRGVVVTRVDDDPYPEIVVANINATEVQFGNLNGAPNMVRASLQILRNAGEASPGLPVATVPLNVGLHARAIVAVDPDRDLDSDFAVVTGAGGPGQLVSVRNDSSAGSLVFGAPLVEPSAAGAIAVAAAHFKPGRRADLLVLENHPLGLLGPDWNGAGLGGMGGGIDGDLDGNGDVDGTDLSMLMSSWNTADAVADIDADGLVSGADLSILMGNW